MAAVLGLSLIAERMSARLAGVLAGFPHGIAIVLYFIGIELGVVFATQAAGFAIAGLSANLVLAFTFSRLSNYPIGIAASGSVLAFLGMALLLRMLAAGPILSVFLTLFTIGFVWLRLRQSDAIENITKPPAGAGEMLLRAGFAAMIVVFITGIAALLGPESAGLLAGFPVVTFPLLVIIHARHGAVPVRIIVRNYPFGLLSLLVFTVTVSWSFQSFGIGVGTGIGLFFALAYLGIASFFKRPG